MGQGLVSWEAGCLATPHQAAHGSWKSLLKFCFSRGELRLSEVNIWMISEDIRMILFRYLKSIWKKSADCQVLETHICKVWVNNQTRYCYYSGVLNICFSDSHTCWSPSWSITQTMQMPKPVNTFLIIWGGLREANWQKMALGHCREMKKHGPA